MFRCCADKLELQNLASTAEGKRVCEQFKKALESHRVVGDEDGLAVTYSQLGKTFLQANQNSQAEKCLNNASEHFIKLGNEPGEAATLRLLADVYEQTGNRLSALRCLERVVQVDTSYGLPQLQQDREWMVRLREGGVGRVHDH